MQQDNSYSLWNELQKWLYLTSQGDGSAFAHLLQAFWNQVYTYTLSYANPSVALEITQAVFLKIWADRESLNAIENFSAYLFSITRDEIIKEPLKNGQLHPANKEAAVGLLAERAMKEEWGRKAFEKSGEGHTGKLIEAFVMKKLEEEVVVLSEQQQPLSVIRRIAIALLVIIVSIAANYLYCNRKTPTKAPVTAGLRK